MLKIFDSYFFPLGLNHQLIHWSPHFQKTPLEVVFDFWDAQSSHGWPWQGNTDPESAINIINQNDNDVNVEALGILAHRTSVDELLGCLITSETQSI